MNEENKIDRSREYLAHERTFLAWIRTSIALMGFGFVIVKFSIFLKNITFLIENVDGWKTKGYSSLVGVIMIGLGVIVAVLSYWQYIQTKKDLDKNFYKPSSTLLFFITFMLILGGIVLILYLLSVI